MKNGVKLEPLYELLQAANATSGKFNSIDVKVSASNDYSFFEVEAKDGPSSENYFFIQYDGNKEVNKFSVLLGARMSDFGEMLGCIRLEVPTAFAAVFAINMHLNDFRVSDEILEGLRFKIDNTTRESFSDTINSVVERQEFQSAEIKAVSIEESDVLRKCGVMSISFEGGVFYADELDVMFDGDKWAYLNGSDWMFCQSIGDALDGITSQLATPAIDRLASDILKQG